MRYRAVLLDLFGTLVKNPPIEALNETTSLMSRCLGVAETPFREMWLATNQRRLQGEFGDARNNIAYVLREMGISRDSSTIDEAVSVYAAFIQQNLSRVKPDCLTMLDAIRSLGMPMALVSDAPPETARLWPERALAGYFETATFSSELGVTKPDARIYRTTTEKLGVSPEECIYIGDGGNNELDGAMHLGMRAVQVVDTEETPGSVFRHNVQAWNGERILTLADALGYLKP